jgi:hypothetical protein
VDELRHYCTHCGAPVGAYTLCLPFEHIRGYGEFLVRSARASLKGNGISWLARLLGLAVVLVEFPFLFLLLPLGYMGRREPSAGPENRLTDSANR